MLKDKASYNLKKIQNNIVNQNVVLDSYPAQIHFLMIDKCNARCIMCGGDYFRSKSGRLITLDNFKRMASNLQLEFSQGIVLAGAGDPLLNPHLIHIIQYANEKYPHLSVALTTNGIALSEEMSRALLQCRLNIINISINAASRDVYKRIMQVDCFDRICDNVQKFIVLRRLQGSGPAVQFSSAINRLNIEDLPRMVELGKQIGMESINVMYCRFYPERIRHLNVGREEDRLRNEDSLFFHQELSDQMVERTKSLAKQVGMHFGHEPLFKEYADPQPCSWPQTELMVGFDGEIYPCGGGELHFKDKVEKGIYHFGNALHEPIEKFWNGDLYRALRISCKNREQGPVVECRTCANGMRPNELNSHIMHWEEAEKAKEIPGDEKESRIPKKDRTTPSPLVSVIVPTHNRPERLVETLRSILEQSYQNLEIIVINDAGADIENIISYLNQKKNITYIKHSQNRGLAAARNTGIKVARGKYIAYLDDDDLFYPDHLETLVNYLETTDFKVAYTDAYRAHEKKEKGKYTVIQRDVPYSFDFDYDRILVGNFVPVLCFMHEKSCVEEAGFFDEQLTTLEDWDLWIRMSRKFKFAHIKEITCEFSWRVDGTTMTSSRQMDFKRSSQLIYERYSDYAKNNPRVSAIHQKLLGHFSQKSSLCQPEESRQGSSLLLPEKAEWVQKEYDRVQTLIKEGREEEAVPLLEKLLGICPSHAQGHDDLGALYFRRGDKQRALDHFIQSFQADPQNTNALKNLADLSLEMGHVDEAIQFYRKILAAQPKDVDALLGVGNYCVQTGKMEEAKGFYERVIKIEPENTSAKAHLETLENLSAAPPASRSAEDADRLSIMEEESLKLHEKHAKKKAEEEWSSQSLQALPESVFREPPQMPQRDLVSIIILVHNQLAYTQKCLESIFAHTHSPFELILVDNGSTDGTGDYLKGVREGNIEVGGWKLKVGEDDKVGWKKETPKGEKQKGIGKGKKKNTEEKREKREPACQSFKLIHNETNQGFALGNNQGIRAAQGDYLLLLNNDVVVTPGWLSRMKACAEKEPKIGIVGPMSNYVSGPQQVQEVSYDTGTLDGLDRFADLFAERHAGQTEAFWRVVGFCMLIKRTVVEKIGGLDGRFGLGNFEDDDFSLRARLAGFESRIAKDSFVHHFGNRTFRGAQINFAESLKQNWELFKKKWAIPSSVAYGESYDLSHLLKEGFMPERHYCTLSPIKDLSKRGEELFAQGDLDGAKKTFEEILMVNPDEREALNNMGVLAYHQEHPGLAADYFTRALKVDSTCTEAMINLGNCLMKQKEFTQATQWFKKALDRNPNDISLLNDLANCLIHLEDFPEAEKIYERSYQLDENQKQVREALAALKKVKGFEVSREAAL